MSSEKIHHIAFPPVHSATDEGLLAMGGDLGLDSLISAYSQGIFPWFNEGQPVLWWSPDPRMVLFPERFKLSRSLRKIIRQQRFSVTCDQAFARVVKSCALRGLESPFRVAPPTWITDDMEQAYQDLFDAGYAHSIEVWHQGELAGGLYGVVLGSVFFGESMFSEVSNSSKVGLLALSRWLTEKRFSVIDCQVASPHLETLGAEEIPRDRFLSYLENIDIQQASKDFSDGFDSDILLT